MISYAFCNILLYRFYIHAEIYVKYITLSFLVVHTVYKLQCAHASKESGCQDKISVFPIYYWSQNICMVNPKKPS